MVYSITSRATFERIERFRNQILRVQDRDDVPMILVGNKVDRAAIEREVSPAEGEALARQLGCDLSACEPYRLRAQYVCVCVCEEPHALSFFSVETSAKTRYNLEAAYYTVVRIIRSEAILSLAPRVEHLGLTRRDLTIISSSVAIRSARRNRICQEAVKEEALYHFMREPEGRGDIHTLTYTHAHSHTDPATIYIVPCRSFVFKADKVPSNTFLAACIVHRPVCCVTHQSLSTPPHCRLAQDLSLQ